MLTNQLHSLDSQPWGNYVMQQNLKAHVVFIKEQTKKLQSTLETMVEEMAPRMSERLQSIPGVGARASTMLIVLTEGFKRVDNHRQLICLAGLSPREYSSGSSVRAKVKICKMGGGQLRNTLYMCSMSAIKKNRTCKDLYDRLRGKGKNGRLALIAVSNKLLKQAFAIAKSGDMYNEDYSTLFRKVTIYNLGQDSDVKKE